MKKQDCLDYLESVGVVVAENESALMLKSRVKDWISKNVPMEIEVLTEEAGHKLLFTPPYHSDLQPIELTWARVKGNVGRQYSVGSTLKIVHTRLMKEFEVLEQTGQEAIEKMIEKCAKIAKKFYDEMPREEADNDDDGDDDDSIDGNGRSTDDDIVCEDSNPPWQHQ